MFLAYHIKLGISFARAYIEREYLYHIVEKREYTESIKPNRTISNNQLEQSGQLAEKRPQDGPWMDAWTRRADRSKAKPKKRAQKEPAVGVVDLARRVTPNGTSYVSACATGT